MQNAVADIDQPASERPTTLEQELLARQLESVARVSGTTLRAVATGTATLARMKPCSGC